MSLNHGVLGRMRGKESEDGRTIQYRGIKYADIPGRWQDPVLISQPVSFTGSELDATKFGPSSPQHPGGFAFDVSLVGNLTLTQESTEQSEFECLNLDVTVPAGKRAVDKLPVFVWIHGGGLGYGNSSWHQYDLVNFVGTSAEIGQPVIGVSINYRLGFFGFLASDELGISGNFGLKDVACGFQWVKKHIAGFGGDPERLTAVGESAGSIIISTLLVANEKNLFEQAIMMSGDTTLRRARKMEWQNSQYEANIKFFSLENVSSEERRKAFYEMKVEDVIKKLPLSQYWVPTVDGSYITEEVLKGMLTAPWGIGKPDWCKRVMVGDTAHDGNILKNRIMDNPDIMIRLRDSLKDTLTSAESKRLLDAYSLSRTLSPEQQYKGLLGFASDLRFYFPLLQAEKGSRGVEDRKCFRYHFHQQNPIEGPWKGYASHEIDVAYLLGSISEVFPPEHQRFGKEMAAVWIKFTYGGGWRTGNGKEVMVIGPDEKITFEGSDEYDEKYRKGRGKLLEEIGWEKCFKLAEMVQGVYGERMPAVPSLVPPKL
ncbi:alpha/beta-hydrolase [Acephala macrosclerotiorum]|nr:alpha/beta-hydrolase [Acephala macrosclerotiorum]